MIADHIAGKRLALLKQMIPRSTRIAILTQTNPKVAQLLGVAVPESLLVQAELVP